MLCCDDDAFKWTNTTAMFVCYFGQLKLTLREEARCCMNVFRWIFQGRSAHNEIECGIQFGN